MNQWRILLADDNVDNRFIITSVLDFHDIQVIQANDGQQALDLIRSTPGLTAALIDIMMPNITGWQLLEIVRQDPALAHLKVIAVTANELQGFEEKILKAGFDGYISKPIDVVNFISQIATIINKDTA